MLYPRASAAPGGWRDALAGVKRPGSFEQPSLPPAKRLQVAGPAAGTCATSTGEVRFESAEEAQQAVDTLNGTELDGCTLDIRADRTSKDGTKLLVMGLPPSIVWTDLKAHFETCGSVRFANVLVRGAGGDAGAGGSAGCVGEVRFETAEECQTAIAFLDGTEYKDKILKVRLDETSKDGTKVFLTNLPSGVTWQELKEHCQQAGEVKYANITGPGASSGKQGEVRYDNPEHATLAVRELNESMLLGYKIRVELNGARRDMDKVNVFGLGPNVAWQDLKDHFGKVGQVAHAAVHGGEQKGGKGVPMAPVFGGGERYGPVSMMMPMPVFGWNAYGPPAMFAMGKGGFGKAMMKGFPAAYAPAFGGKKGGGGGGGPSSAEVRFDDPAHAAAAVEHLNGSELGGAVITVQMDQTSSDGSKVLVTGVPGGIAWQELKDHFKQVGQVAFAQMVGGGGKGFGGKGFGGKGMAGGGGPRTAEVRFDQSSHAQLALQALNGTVLGSQVINVALDPSRPDQDKLIVTNLDPALQWQELKDHFKQCGQVAFVQIS